MSGDYEGRYSGTATCRLCGTTEDITRHHLMPRRLAEDWKTFRPALFARRPPKAAVCHRCNIVKLCGRHHRAVERKQLRAELGALLTPNERKHVEKHAGRAWLDANYPYTSVAQGTEQPPPTRMVAGSTPAGRLNNHADVVELADTAGPNPAAERHAGSSPAVGIGASS